MTNILMVEDDSTIAFGVKYALEQEGFNVDICKDLESSRENIEKKEYDIILLDVMLPDGNGYDLCKEIRNIQDTPIIFLTACDEEVNIVMGLDIGGDDYIVMLPDGNGYDLCKEIRNIQDTPIIFLTACDEEVNIVMGLDIGGDDYMTKPFRVRELISRIKAVLRRRGKNNESKKVLKFGNLSIHTLEARVYKNGEEVFLTSVEYKLLLILIQNKNTVLSRSQILEKLWDVTYDFVNDNTLTVYIKRLREKVEDDSTDPQHIITVRGLGYKWNGCENDVSI